MSDLSSRFKEIRKIYGLNQKEFATQLGISQNHISSIENDKEKPSLMLIKYICLKYNIDEEWLMEGVGSPSPDYDSLTDTGLISKYNDLRTSLEQMLYKRSGDELRNSVVSFACLINLLLADNLRNDNKTVYLEAVAKCMDALESLNFKSFMLKNLYSKKPDYKVLLTYKNDVDMSLALINSTLKEMSNIYIKQYDLEFNV